MLSGTHEDMMKIQDERRLNKVKKEIKSEELEAAKPETKATPVTKVGSLFGSNCILEIEETALLQENNTASRYKK